MTDPVDRISRVNERRIQERRGQQRRAADAAKAKAEADALLPAHTGAPVIDHPQPAPSPLDSASVYAAQLLGQSGQKRGLRGGKPVLDEARAAYLGAEYSGEHDRRPPKGLLKKTDI